MMDLKEPRENLSHAEEERSTPAIVDEIRK
jgi:hypothetical protein